MTTSAFYILLITICLAALWGYFFVWKVLGRIANKIIGFLAKAVLIAVLVAATYLFAPKYISDHKPVGASAGCRMNGEAIALALEGYAKTNKGRYPATLDKLPPRYLLSLPKCPAAEKDTYSRTYQAAKDGKRYTFYCADLNHNQKKFTGKIAP